MNGVVASVTTAAALDTVPQVTGSAAALLGALQFGSGILASTLLAVFNNGTPFHHGSANDCLHSPQFCDEFFSKKFREDNATEVYSVTFHSLISKY